MSKAATPRLPAPEMAWKVVTVTARKLNAVSGFSTMASPDTEQLALVTINPGNSRLVMANIVSNEFSSEYNEYEEMRGAAYYELADGSLIRNRAYPDIPILRRFRGEPLAAYCTLCRAPLYSLVGNDKDALEFLNRPERYLPELTKCLEG